MTDERPSAEVLEAWGELSARSRPRMPAVRPVVRGGRRPSPASTLGSIAAIAIGVVVALAYLGSPGGNAPGTPALPGSSSAGASSAPTTTTASRPPTATRSAGATRPLATPSFSEPSPVQGHVPDGIPLSIGGRPVLRGDGIRTRATAGGAGSFLAAGWVDYAAGRPCPSSSPECTHIELDDRPGGDEATPAIELLSKHGQDWPSWAPGYFSILEVRVSRACAKSERICLAVDAGISPPPDPTPAPLPTPATVTYDDTGIPITVDGEPVFRDFGIRPHLVRGGTSFLVTGRLQDIIYDCVEGACPLSTVRVLQPPAPIALPTSGIAPEYVLLDASQGGTWGPYDTRRWPNDLVVLRVRAYDLACPWDRFCDGALLVEAAIPPPASLPPSSNAPTIPTAINGEQVVTGAQIDAVLGDQPGMSFLAAGRLFFTYAECPAPSCPQGNVAILREPAPAAGAQPTVHYLLVDGALWKPLPEEMVRWPGRISVLRVHGYDLPCPWLPLYCDGQLVVEDVIPPP